jgi:hypothetical protein
VSRTRVAACLLFAVTTSLGGPARHAWAQPLGETAADRIYWGGGISVAFWDYTRIRIEPLVGYRVTRSLSAGVKLMGEYLRYEQFGYTVSSFNYGGSLFTRYRFIEQLYGHAEFGGANYETVSAQGVEARIGYPFLLLGGGFVQRTGRRTSLYFEILYDVLQDEDSPYSNGGPFLSIGVAVGF